MYYRTEGSTVVGDSDERYEFLTPEVAYIFAGILQRDLTRFYGVGSTAYYTFASSDARMQIANSWVFNQHEVARWDSAGKLLKLDLPYLIWTWLKLSAGARFLRTLWYGVGRG